MTFDLHTPRSFSSTPRNFGKCLELTWLTPEEDDLVDAMHAAAFQHSWSLAVRTALQSQRHTVSDYAARANVSYDRTVKVLRGERSARLTDVTQSQRLLAHVFDPALFPTALFPVTLRLSLSVHAWTPQRHDPHIVMS